MKTIRVRMYRRNPSKTRRRKARRPVARKHRRWGVIAAHKRRVNPSRKRRTTRRRNPIASRARRRNPSVMRSLRGALSRGTLMRAAVMRAAGLGVGFIGGLQINQLLATGSIFGRAVFTPPAILSTTLRPGLGLVSVLVGGAVAAKARKPLMKDIGLGIVAAGGVDVIRSIMTIASPGAAAAVGMYVNEGMPAFASRPMPLGMGVRAPRTGRIGPRYTIPTRNMSVGGYADSSFADVESSFAAT